MSCLNCMRKAVFCVLADSANPARELLQKRRAKHVQDKPEMEKENPPLVKGTAHFAENPSCLRS